MKYLIIIIFSFFISLPVFASNSYHLDLEDTNSQYVDITDASQTNLDIGNQQDFTHMMWVKAESFGTYNYIYMKGDTGASNAWYGAFINTANNKVRCYVDDGTTANYVEASTAFNTGTWYHLICRRTGDFLEVWIDGSNENYVRNSNVDNDLSNSYPFAIGRRSTVNGSTLDRYWDGEVDDFRFYNSALATTSITSFYDCELDGTADEPSNLISMWKFENNLLDFTATNNDLTNNNSAIFDSGTAPYTNLCTNPTATSTPTEASEIPEFLPDINDLTFITGVTEHYDGTSTAVSHYHQTYIHFPFIGWLIICLIFIPILPVIILEIIIRLRGL